MADYRELLRKAVDVLPENNGAARRQVYEKARNALVAQLRAIQPPLPAREITQHRLQLEDCIREVEQAATEDLLAGARAQEEAAAKAKANPAPVTRPAPAPVPAPPPAPAPQPTPAVATPPEPAPKAEPTPPPAPAAAPEPEPKAEEKPAPTPPAEVEAKTAPEEKAQDLPQVEPETGSKTSGETAPAALDAPAENKPAPILETKSAVQDDLKPETQPESPTEAEIVEKPADQSAKEVAQGPDQGPDDVTAKIDAPEAKIAPLGVTEKPAPERKTPPPSISFTEPDAQSETNSKASEAAIQQLIQEAVSDTARVAPPVPSVPVDFNTPKRPSAPVADLKIDLTGTRNPAPPITPTVQSVAMSSEREVDLDLASADLDTDSDAQGAVDRAIEALDREARGVEPAPVEPEPLKPIEIKRAKRSTPKFDREDMSSGAGGGGVTIFLVVLALLIVGAGGAGFWAWREGYVDLDAMFGQSTSVTDTAEKAPATPAGPGNTAAAPDAVAPVAQDLGKSDERLPGASGTDTPTAQADAADPPAKTDERLGADTSFTPNEQNPAADSGTNNNASAPVAGAPSGAQSLLLEASTEGTTGAVPFSGNVEWTRGVDELGQPTLIAKANIPARNLSVDVLIRRNADQTLPASHLIEVDFSVSDSFVGGAVASLPGILLKNEELVRGVPLVGASARVVGNSFLFALSAAPQDLGSNLQLLGTRKWMDLALIYATSTRAIITLEKDAAAQKLFDEVLAVWAQADKDAAAAAPASN